MSKYPIIKVTILFTIGILFQSQFNLYLLSLIIISSIIFLIAIIKKTFKEPIVTRVLIPFALILSGAIHYSINFHTVSYPFDSPKIRNAKIIGQINNIELITNKKLSIELTVKKINDSLRVGERNNKFILNIWEDSLSTVYRFYNQSNIGNSISLIGTIARAKNARNPGEFDYEKYLNENGISGVINCYKPEQIEIIGQEYLTIPNIVFNVRKGIDEIINKNHSPASAALLKGVLLADRKDLDYDIRNSFVNSGVIHVLAVSGLHVGFITGIFFLLFGRFDIRIKYLLTIFGILLFLIITGGHSSVFRASTMAIVFLVAKLTARNTNGFNSIAIAAFILLLLDPNELFNPGFQLSFSAVLSILVIYPIFSEKIKRLNIKNYFKNILLFCSVSLAAQLGTMPFTLIYFNKLSIISIFANLLVIPIIGIIVALGIITLIFAFASPVATIFASANTILIEGMFNFVNFTSNLSFSFLPIYNFSIIDGLLFY
ncbi:MAG: ComEC family competence protein, partial [Melioribacteraceae bacterium]|nr:ComEC family competence protein [Melioribacteraceae bacterium]